MLSLKTAFTIVETALQAARSHGFKPLAVAVFDVRGAMKAVHVEDGCSLKRAEIACGKASGALALGVGSRTLHKMAVDRPHFMAAVSHAVGSLIPVPGGVLIRDQDGELVGAIGVSGDTSDNDEIAALAGIAAVDLKPDTGA